MANEYVNKVIVNDKTIIDLTGDSVTSDKMLAGTTAHDAAGAPIVGTAVGGTLDHSELNNRDATDQHPMSAITGLVSALTNNITGSGTNGYLAKFSDTNTLTTGPSFGSSTSTYLRNDGTWATPANTDTKVTQNLITTNGNYPILLKNSTTATDSPTNTVNYGAKAKINPSTGNLTITQINGVNVGSSPKFTDTVTTVTNSGSGNAVTSISASNGILTVTKGSTFLTSHQDISGKENTSNKVTSWSATPNDTHYPSEKLVADAFSTTEAGITAAIGEVYSKIGNVETRTVYYGKCGTAGDVAAKVVNVNADFVLQWGSMIRIYFTYGNNTGSTLPTLNVNNTGAKPIRSVYGSSSPAHWNNIEILEFMYVGDVWLEVGYRSDKLTRLHFENAGTWTGWSASTTQTTEPAGGYRIMDGMCMCNIFWRTGSSAMNTGNPLRTMANAGNFPTPLHGQAILTASVRSNVGDTASCGCTSIITVNSDGSLSLRYGGNTVPANAYMTAFGFYPVDPTWLTNHGYTY